MGKGSLLVSILLLGFYATSSLAGNLTVVVEWSQLEFAYENNATRASDIASGDFLVGEIVPIDTDVDYTNDRIFVTIPRFETGIPATLGTVTNETLNGNPIIKPYPDWTWHRNSSLCNTNRIVSTFRVKIDECGRLWVLDTGKVGTTQLCSPQILAFNLTTDELIVKHEIALEAFEAKSVLVTPVIDVRGKCSNNNTFVYMLDCQINTLFVFDQKANESWRIQDKTFFPYPSNGTFHIAGEQFDLMDGLLGGALSPYVEGEERVLYYHAMASSVENWVNTSNLWNKTFYGDNYSFSAPQYFHAYPKRRSSQSAPEAMDSKGILYFGLMEDIKIGCWNRATDYGMDNIDFVATDAETLQFASGVKIVQNKSKKEELWVLTSSFQKFMTGTLNSTEVNFRILSGKTDDLLKGTKCIGN